MRAHEPAPASGREQAVAVSRLYEGSAAEARPAKARPAEEAPAAPAPTFEDLIEAYPHAKVDNRSRLRSLWEALPFEQRRLAVQTIPAFLADRKVAGYKGRMPATEYLAGQNWIGLEAQAAKRAQAVTRGQPLTIDGYTTNWWLLLFDRAFSGKSLGFWMGQAEAKKPLTATGADLAEAAARVGSLQPYRCDGPEIEAWRPWLAARGARIPPFRGDFRVFLPGPTPPGGKAEAGDDEVRF